MALTPFPTEEHKSNLTPFPSMDEPQEIPQAPETPYSELSAWDLLKAGDIKGLAGRLPGNTQTDMADSFANVGSEDNANGLLNNAGRDITEWGNTFAEDLAAYTMSQQSPQFGQWNQPTPETAEDVLNQAAGMGQDPSLAWKMYEDVARPAGMIAVTPGVPAPIRMGAGAIYAPKFASDIANSFGEKLEGGTDENGNPIEAQGILGAAGSTLWETVAEPFTNLASNLYNDPSGLAERIYEHPATLWDEVLVPVTMGEGVVRGGKKAYDRYQETQDFVSNLEDLNPYRGNDGVARTEFDNLFEGVSEQESGGRYDAVNADSGASGRYQIMPENWESWAEEAGLGRDAEFTPEKQDTVARFKMRQYYDEYGPEGALVAWYAGPENARRWAAGEITDVWGRDWDAPQDNAPSIAEYVREASEKAEKSSENNGGEKYYTILDEVSDTGITDLTEQKLNLIARDYRERYGDNLEITSMKRNGDGSSWHDDGQAFDLVSDRLAGDAEARAWLVEQGKKYGLYGLDEYEHPSEHATGGHIHFSDHGEPLEGIEPIRGGAKTSPRGHQEPTATMSEAPAGELTDMFGRGFSQTEESITRMGQAQEALNKRIEQLEKQKAALEQANTYGDNPMSARDMYANMERLNRELEQAQVYREQLGNAIEGMKQRIQGVLPEVDQRKGTGRYESFPESGSKVGDIAKERQRRLDAIEEQKRIDEKARKISRSLSEVDERKGTGRYESFPEYGSQIGNVVKRGRDIQEARKQNEIQTMESIIADIQKDIDDAIESQLNSMKANPGGKGVTTNYTFSGGVDERGRGIGQITGRGTVSNNPEWYQRFYKEHGRAPRQSEMRDIAIEELRNHEEFDTLLQQKEELERLLQGDKERAIKPGEVDIDALWDDVNTRYEESVENTTPIEEKPKAEPEADSMMEDIENQIFMQQKPGQGNIRTSQNAGTQSPQVTGSSQSPARLGREKPTGKYEGETVTQRQIFDRARELFGSIRIGRNPRGTSGIYDARQDVARTDHYGNWETMWHEVGHRLDSALDLANSYDVQEAHAAMQRAYPNQKIPYSASEIPHEGVAEFVREYMTDPATARQNFPTLSKEFERRMAGDKELAARVSEMQDMMRRSAEQDSWAKVGAAIAEDRPKEIWDSVKEAAGKFEEEWLDGRKTGMDIVKYIEERTGQKLTDEQSLYVQARLAEARGIAHAKILLEESDGVRAARQLKKVTGLDLHEATFQMGLDKLKEFAKTHADWLKEKNMDVQKAITRYLIGRRLLDVREYKFEEPLRQLEAKAQAAEQAARQAEAAEAKAKADLKANKGYQNRAQLMNALDKAHAKAVEARKAAREAAHAYESRKAAGFQMPVELQDAINVVETAPKELVDAAQVFWDVNDNLLKLMEQGGIISHAQYKALRKNGEHYISLAREFPDDANVVEGMMGHGFINVPNTLKKLSEYGSTFDIQDPLKNMENNIGRVCNIVERNKVGRTLVEAAQKYDGLGEIAEKVSDSATARDSSFTVWENGKKEVYNTTPEVYRFMKGLTPDGAAGFFGRFMQYSARIMRAGATVANMAFGAVNIARDNLGAFMLSRHWFFPVVDSVAGFWEMAKGEYLSRKFPEWFDPNSDSFINGYNLWEEYKAGGIEFSTETNAGRDFSAKQFEAWRNSNVDKVKRLVKSPLLAMEYFNNLMENATRVGVYRNARKAGDSKTSAVMDARESTLDFGAGGTEARKLNKYIPFLNAGIQGTLKFARMCKEYPAMMATRIGIMGLGTLLLQAYIRDDDEYSKLYDELHDYEKAGFWMIPSTDSEGNKNFISIPKPFVEGQIASAATAMIEHYSGKDERALKRWSKEMLKAAVPGFGELGAGIIEGDITKGMPTNYLPPVIKTMVELASNYDMFRQRDIVPYAEKDLSPSEQYDLKTSEMAKGIGKALNISPRKIDHAGRGLFAGNYDNLNWALQELGPLKSHGDENPITKRFHRDPLRSPQSVQDFYQRKAYVNGKHKDLTEKGNPMEKEDLQDYKRIQGFDKAIRQFNKQLKAAEKKEDRKEYERIMRNKTNFIRNARDKLNKKY